MNRPVEIINPVKQLDSDGSEAQRPSLVRLDLQAPINLIRGLESDPTYRHPLLARLLKLISWPHPDPIPHDLPSLRRQHHRLSESLNHLWTSTFAPKTAAEILGDQNLQSAQTLKSWLLEIGLKEATHSNHSQDHKTPSIQNRSANRPGNQKKGSTAKRRKKTRQKAEGKKRVIIRAVSPRKRKKARRLVDGGEESDDGLDDFIVSDSDEDTIYAHDILLSDSETRAAGGGCSPRKRQRSMSVLHPELAPTAHHHQGSEEKRQIEGHEVRFEFEHLTNLILLKGPHGSGKSCSVQAVAHELGWEVFEVNPSQLRTRKEVDRLIGDVSKNHVLSCSSKQSSSALKHSTHSAPPSNPPKLSSKLTAPKKMNAFEKMMKATRKPVSKTEHQVIIIDEETPAMVSSKLEGSSDRPSQKIKQSLILLEEVDIVYGQDKEFWAGVIELVSKSMRPVVMTCNDSSVLPMDSLPVQTVLEFRPAPVELVSGFLEVVCMVEGHLVERELLGRFYREHVFEMPVGLKLMRSKRSATHQVELFQEPGLAVPFDTVGDHPPDLRRTLCQLQFLCQWAIGSTFSGVDWLDLDEDRTSKMLFSSNSFSLPSSLHQYLPLPTRSDDDPLPFDRFEKHQFQLDWLHSFFAQHPSPRRSDSGRSNHPDPPDRSKVQPFLAHELEFLARAHEDLSFGDAYVDKDEEVEVEQFEGEIMPSSTDNVLISASTTTNNPTIVEIKRPWKSAPELSSSTVTSSSSLVDEVFDWYDFQYQHVSPKRPFTGPHYRHEKDGFFDLLHAIFSRFFSLDLASHPRIANHMDYLITFFTPFNHAHLVQTRSRKLKEMDEYMDYRGSRAFVLPLQDYLTDYSPLVRLIVEAQYLSSASSLIVKQKKPGRLTRASALTHNAPSSLGLSHPSSDLILDLSPIEIELFRNASSRFLR